MGARRAAAFERTDCEAMGGRIELRLEGDRPRWLTAKRLAYLSQYDLGPLPRLVHAPPLPFGANFALRRSALNRIEPFRDGLDRVGTTLISNGETELLRRLLTAGGQIVYWPRAEVLHRVPAKRLTKSWFRERAMAQGISDIRSGSPSRMPHLLLVGREIMRAGRALPILARRLSERRGGFDALLWLTSCQGRIEELGRQRRLHV